MIEDLKKAIEIIVPHENEKQFYKSILDKVDDNFNDLFEDGKYRFGYPDSLRNDLTTNNKEMIKYLFFDLLTETYFTIEKKSYQQRFFMVYVERFPCG